MGATPRAWFDVSVAANHAIAIQPEGGGTLPSMNWQSLSTNHCEQCNPPRASSGSGGQYVQSIDRYKWLEPKCSDFDIIFGPSLHLSRAFFCSMPPYTRLVLCSTGCLQGR